MEAHPRVLEAGPGALEAHPGEGRLPMELCLLTMEWWLLPPPLEVVDAQRGVVCAHPKTTEAQLWTLTWSNGRLRGLKWKLWRQSGFAARRKHLHDLRMLRVFTFPFV
jgi:hypothetical protein